MVRTLAATAALVASLAIGCGASRPPETTVALAAPPAAQASATSEPRDDGEPTPSQPRSKPSPRAEAAEPDPEAVARNLARKLFQEGAQAYDEGDYMRARDKFKEAYDLVQNQALLFNIASAEMRLGNVAQACHLFRKYVNDGDPADPRIQEVQKQVAQRCRGTP
jgi:tetratricopeptide (TPR) repeat protein